MSSDSWARAPEYSSTRENLAPNITKDAAGTVTFRPLYGPGVYLNARLCWTNADLKALQQLMEARVSLTFAADVLARPPTSIITALRNRGVATERPKHWSVRREQKRNAQESALLQYPYVTAAKPDHNGMLLAVNSMVARAYPEHMRADLCQDIMLALLQGETTLEKLRARGIRPFVTQWRKVQREDEYWPSLDAPRENGHAWHEVLSEEHSVWLGQGYYVDTGPAQFRKIVRPKISGKRAFERRKYGAEN